MINLRFVGPRKSTECLMNYDGHNRVGLPEKKHARRNGLTRDLITSDRYIYVIDVNLRRRKSQVFITAEAGEITYIMQPLYLMYFLATPIIQNAKFSS